MTTWDQTHIVRDFQALTKDDQRHHLVVGHGLENPGPDSKRGPSRYYALHVEAHNEEAGR